MTRTPVIGIVGDDVPRQLVLAAGALPHRLTGGGRGPVSAESLAHLGAVDPPVARILTALLGPQPPALDGLIVCNDAEAHLRLFSVLRMLTGRGLPPLLLLDLPREDTPASRRFAQLQLTRMLDFCVGVTGAAPGPAEWHAAAVAEAAVGAAVSRLRARRRSATAPVPGAAALTAMLAASRVAPEVAVRLLDQVTGPAPVPPVRVHVTGSGHPDAEAYAALEAEGLVIVGEDHDTGDLAWFGGAVEADAADAVIDGLVGLHLARPARSSVGSIASRARLCRDGAVAAAADVALALVRAGDDAPLWDLADASALLAEAGVPLVRRVRLTPETLHAELRAAAASVREAAGVAA